MPDPHETRAAEAVGPALGPGESTYATFDNPAHYHDGHQDTYLVSKDRDGNVSGRKEHVDDNGNWW